MQLNFEAVEWDAVIVGTGMGGATLGYALAKAGRRVLFVERGLDLRSSTSGIIRDRFVEDDPVFSRLPAQEQANRIAQGGRAQDEVSDDTDGQVKQFQPYIGSGTGGSTALYGMVLERLFPADFLPGTAHVARDGSSLPDAWPIRYQDLSPWYRVAEQLYRVRGQPDPLRAADGEGLLPPPPISETGSLLFQALSSQGLNPYRLHVASEGIPDCRTCQGFLCGSRCKNDAASVCLTPAVEQYGAGLMTECTALSLDADRTQVTGLRCSWKGRSIHLRAKLYVLAAGALLTPALLMNSSSTLWPDGLANKSGLVGRNLMRHAIDLYVLTKAPEMSRDNLSKELGFNDFYDSEHGKLGSVQSFGPVPSLDYLRSRRGFNPWRLLGPVAALLWRTYSRQPVLGAIMEDHPYVENQVRLGESIGSKGKYRLSMRYALSPADVQRRKLFRKLVGQALAAFGPRRVAGTTDRPALGHVCGTCRFGTDPATSVLDPWNRAHGISNLYVVDGSFFPTSSGINPALTIAANALRVADHLQSAAE